MRLDEGQSKKTDSVNLAVTETQYTSPDSLKNSDRWKDAGKADA